MAVNATSPTPPGRRTSQTLLFDADDTLWENNIYFERAIAAFISCLDHQLHTPAEVREHLNAVEHATIAQHGYGLKSFRRSLVACFEQLSDVPLDEARRDQIHSFANAIAEQEMELVPQVAATLRELAQRHRLILVTKGDDLEQRDKLARSGLGEFFAAVEVVPEKNTACYRAIAARYNCAPAQTWMIGNSPKSDINPAMAAGLNAIFIPHGFTWVMEHEELSSPPQGVTLLELAGLPMLLESF